MRRARSAWIGILVLNLAWLLILPGTGDKAAALVGVALSAIPIFLPVASRWPNRSEGVAGEDGRVPPLLLILPFLLPAVALLTTPRIASWDLDGRSWLILAWLWTASVVSLVSPRSPSAVARVRAVAGSTVLFVVAASAFWLSVVADLGISRVVRETDRTTPMVCRSDVLTTAFSIWEANPPREHLFLGWRSDESFRARAPYANHVHPYLFTMYAWVTLIREATGVPTYVATNSTPLFYMLVLLAGFTTLLVRAGLLQQRMTPLSLTTLFVAYGLLVTAWRFWHDLYRFGSDNPYPLLMGVFLFVYAFLLAPMRPAAATVSATAFVALSPIHLPMLLIAVFALFGTTAATLRGAAQKNRDLLVLAGVATAAGLISLLTPRLLIASNGYEAVGSSYLIRSGLDGDTRYFSNLFQAAVSPCIRGGCCWPRPIDQLAWPALVPLVVLPFAGFRTGFLAKVSFGHLLMFLTTPYFVSLVLFPQSVSIHPYLYDHMLLIPAAVFASSVMLTPGIQNRLRGPALLGFLLLSGALLMANLNGIAQSIASIPR